MNNLYRFVQDHGSDVWIAIFVVDLCLLALIRNLPRRVDPPAKDSQEKRR